MSGAETWIKASFFRAKRDTRPLPVGLELGYFVSQVAPHGGPVRAVDDDELDRLKHELPLVSFATYPEGATRGLEHVQTVTALAFDVDEPEPTADAFTARLSGALDLRWFVCTSFRAKPGALKFRAIAPVSRPMTPDEHRDVWQLVADALARGGVAVDPATKDPCRAWFVPAIPPTGVYEHRELPGPALDVDLWRSAASEAAAVVAEVEAEVAAFERELARRASARRIGPSRLSPVEMASRYLAKMPPSISDSGGDDALWRAALALHGLGLSEDEALGLLRAEFNPRCKPPWPERWLARKVGQAARSRLPAGFLIERRAS